MAKPKGSHHVVSAAFTASGAPCYRRADGTWSPNLQEAVAMASEAERDEALKQAGTQEALVCDAYSFMVTVDGGVIDALSARETIRAKGPTVRMRRPDSGARA